MKSSPASRIRWIILSLALLFLPAGLARGQGCSACRDNTAGSAPQMRQALRKAIPILGIPACILFAGIMVLAVRSSKE
jgi:hypothetical protein